MLRQYTMHDLERIRMSAVGMECVDVEGLVQTTEAQDKRVAREVAGHKIDDGRVLRVQRSEIMDRHGIRLSQLND